MNRELFQLTVQGLKRRRRSSALLFAVLFLSFAFAIVTLSVSGSMVKTNEKYRLDTFGEWRGAIPDGLPEDREFLEQQDWLVDLGTSYTLGTLSNGDKGLEAIGTADETFFQVGRIGLQDGRFPENENEIALEAGSLSALGYDYTIGQEITVTAAFPAGETGVTVEHSFTLCGVIEEYSGLWQTALNGWAGQLPAGFVTQGTADQLKQEAEAQAEKLELNIVLDTPAPQYFFTIQEGAENKMQNTADKYLAQGEPPRHKVFPNTLAYGSEQDAEVNTFYAGMIFVVTVLAVLCIYAIQLQKQVRQYALFRSIGIRKNQLRKLVFYETLILALPAAVLGAAGGALGTWLVLKLAVYSGSAPIQISIPWALLGILALVWFLGIVLARLVILQIALREPLTGRITLNHKKARRWKRARKALIGALSALLCGAVVFTAIQAFEPIYLINLNKTSEDYWVYCYKNYAFPEEMEADETYVTPITDDFVEKLESVPGVAEVRASARLYAELRFDGMEQSEYYRSLWQEQTEHFESEHVGERYSPDALAVEIIAPREGDLERHLDLQKLGVDPEAFRRGEQVIVSLCSTVQQGQYFDGGVETGDTIDLNVYGYKPGSRNILPAKGGKTLTSLWRFSPKAVVAHSVPGGYSPYFEMADYTILCSYEYLQSAFAQTEPGRENGVYLSGGDFGYDKLEIVAGLDAEFLSTDSVIAGLCKEKEFSLDNFREVRAAKRQENLQTLILLFTGGGCVLLVLLLILSNTLSMEAQREQRSCGILQALGESKKQLRKRLVKSALLRGLLGAAAGWLLYVAFLLARAPQALAAEMARVEEFAEYAVQPSFTTCWGAFVYSLTSLPYYGVNLWAVLSITAGAIFLTAGLSLLTKRSLLKGELMDKIREEE